MGCTVTMGNALSFRRLLRRGLAAVAAEYVPNVQRTVGVAHTQYPENTYGSEKYQHLDLLADDLGLDLGAADPSLKNALRHLKVNEDDAALWELLPFAYAAVFTAEGWKKSSYVSQLDTYSNNAHVMALAVQKLLWCFQSIVVTTMQQMTPVEVRVRVRVCARARACCSSPPLRAIVLRPRWH
jgi:hypothetical protein